MNYVNNILQKIISNSVDICGLCFNDIETEPISSVDEIGLVEIEELENVAVAEILCYVFGEEVYKNITAFDKFCKQCVMEATDCYKFIKGTKQKYLNFSYITENLISCFEAVPQDLYNSKSLYITLDPDLNVTNQYFGNFQLKNKSEALQRYQTFKNMEKLDTKRENKDEIHKPILINKSNSPKAKIKQLITNTDDSKMLKCEHCLKMFSTMINLKNHCVRMHAPKLFKCDKCPKAFGSQAYLSTHQAVSHVNLICSECGKSFQNKCTLKMHEKSHYASYVCQNCGRVYRNRNTFKKHIENNICQSQVRHSPANAKFTCDYCQKKYTQKMSLRVHIQFEHLGYKYIPCKWCDKKFSCQSRLNAHAVKHTKEKNFTCVICNGKFVSKESLLYHTRIHTGEKPYPCSHCESRFLSASRRAQHVKSYHMDPTVECDICHNKFKSHQYLLKHKKIHQENQETNVYPLVKIDRADNVEGIPVQELNNYPLNTKYFFHIDNGNDNEVRPHLTEATSQNITVTNLQLNDNTVKFIQMDKAESNNESGDHKLYYLEVSDDEDFVMKVSENVEV